MQQHFVVAGESLFYFTGNWSTLPKQVKDVLQEKLTILKI